MKIEHDVLATPEPSQVAAYTVGSLFAGVGGFCRGFKNAGFNVVWANELDPYASKTYRHNNPDVRLIEKSVAELSVNGDHLQPVDVLTAGFPCQPFSVAGDKMGFNDPRGKLFFEITRLISEFGTERPKIIVFENVKNLLHHDKGKTFAKMMDEVQGAGYWFMQKNTAVLNTSLHTDIPQNRERLFMVAFSWDAFSYNDFEFPAPVEIKRARTTFLDLHKKGPDELYFDPDSKYGKMFVESMANGDPDSVYLLRKYFVRENKSDTFFTLTANMGEGGHNVPVIRDEWGIRKLTPIECSRLQGFRDEEFSFPEDVSRTQRYRQIGNAVTVNLIEKLATECRRQLEQHGKEKK
ncbi:Modification methylase HhaI [Paraburkholderia domus]|uniref:DNA cytosine methyltransferase n=1 Tax=Paraburkholderia domus TaxID=2793075 RepID=UPI001911A21E|nr:DNA (cytosine-5-)-methyltransferase [Paraburkholderia domus]MBK5047747.1 DNA (cytosine-5-)-methyltransferase [Burkholderia sp. R-70006]CAE6689445.1 Modification methylase HhaI [Paraburkholderia domus]